MSKAKTAVAAEPAEVPQEPVTNQISNAPTDAKEYGLKPIDIQMINTIQQQANVALSNFISFVVMDRMAYPVDTQTRFEVDNDKNAVKVWQEPAVDVPTDSSNLAPGSAASAIGVK